MGKLFRRQHTHLLAYVILGVLLLWAANALPEGQRPLWGATVADWVAISWLLAFVHQGWIAFFWRLELYGGHISARLGTPGFWIYLAGYLVFGAARLYLLVPIAAATPDSLAMPRWLSVTLIVVSTPPALWGLWAAAFYMGLIRAAGADHFFPAYRRGFERRGIYRYVRNPMYAVVLLLLYHPGLLHHSRLGLLAAAIHHAFVWCAYFFTEKPDLEELYGMD